MNPLRATMALALLAGSVITASAQSNKAKNTWEESQARRINPEIRMVITPQICDMTMLSNEREIYGPYIFDIKSIEDTTNGDLDNLKSNALFLACREADADAVIEVVYHSYVSEKDSKKMYIELSGYPVKYTNFRPASKAEIEMMGVVYPVANSSVMISPSITPNQPNQKGK
ncbi:hypothetical protein E4T81_13045 [Barnesiella sp. WM24]|uniref:hypothetical protein n=1 Tax=Barnesiella sp. WM24 TaxID=2558278 RepID=UPI001072CF83|nr:hypothetical protein [Barnesiella sp. WM24]TFU92233.1 hypothetical protein E4T81_13045 [Barnesiella sp. WM24]